MPDDRAVGPPIHQSVHVPPGESIANVAAVVEPPLGPLALNI
jgi:hypothetical protein